MYRRYLLFLVWAVAIVFILLFGNNRVFPEGFLISFLRFDQSQFDTSVLSLFSLLGVYPFAFFLLFLDEKRFMRPGPLVASIGSFFLGAFVLMPYVALAIPRKTFLPFRRRGWIPTVVALLSVVTTLLLWIALARSDWSIFLTYFKTNQFVRTMTVDLLLFYILQVYLLRRIRLRNAQTLQWQDVIPLFGLFRYLFAKHLPASSKS
ncbi:hypothetical protein ACV3PA_09135 [Exiguobacterium acetylicum]|uniref:hypothetical protein n=1 Tax=Exiguobacterium sp. BMC-KP TaxID=1684312 RepID=UPI0006AA19F2|nr:hypothetical protein [Exiguobacterium sp. BMC-KP]KOP29527.1 hypothetical protein ADM98_11720 [Exiguobacterium sp. BMC-KP]